MELFLLSIPALIFLRYLFLRGTISNKGGPDYEPIDAALLEHELFDRGR